MMTPIIVERTLADGSTYCLGTAIYYSSYGGWRFLPNVSGHSISRKFWPTWEACLPRWVGYPDRCQTRPVTHIARAP